MAEQTKAASTDRFPLYFALAFSLILIFLGCVSRFYKGILYPLDSKWVDHLFRVRGMEMADSRISIVTIDDQSIERIGQYPWPRNVYPRLLDNLFSLGVKVVGFDVIFPNKSPNPEYDRELVESIRKWRDRFVCAVSLESFFKDNHYVFQYPFADLKRAAKYVGFVDQLNIDGDGVVRSSPLMIGGSSFERSAWATDPVRIPSLGLQLAALFEGRPVDDYVKTRNEIRINIRGQEDVLKKTVGAADILESEFGIRRIPAWKVLDRKLTKEEKTFFKGGVVMVGSTAKATFDHFPSPFTDLAPGVEVHANVVDNILNHRELRFTPDIVTIVLVLVFALLATWTVALNPLLSTMMTLGVLIVWIVVNHILFRQLVLTEFTAPSLALLGPFSVIFIRKTLAEQKEKKFIKQTFGQFVAPEVVDDLVKDPGKVKLGGEKREMTVLFLDIAHFTTISEKMSPEALILFLNKYLSALSRVVHQHKGVVDKYIGDCIMAFWNAPLEQKDHRLQACLTAVECQQVMGELNKNLDPGLPELPAIRIGLNSGDMTVGLTGSEQKLQYTVIGDEVNLSSRLEGANKFFGSKIMVSEACYDGAKDAIEGRFLGAIKVIGKAIPVRVYELVGKKGELSEDWKKALTLYNKGLDLFYKGVEFAKKKENEKSQASFAEAKGVFIEALKIFPKDGPAKLYSNMADDYSQILPPELDGIFNMTSK